MIFAERQTLIEKLVKDQGSVTIEALLKVVPVSKMTLWRDITLLHEQGRIRKVHGGVSRVEVGGAEEGFQSKSFLNGETKDRIARVAAARFIRDGEVLLLEGGTTVMHMVRHIRRQGITILTNGLNTLNAASESDQNLTVMVCGGILRKPSLTFVGPEAHKFFDGFAADVFFLSGTGLSLDRGLTDPNPLEIEVKLAMIRCARKVVLLVDSSKFNIESLKTVVRLEEVDAIVTDQASPPEFLKAVEDQGVEVVLAD